jgi:hypothetical protein
MSICRTARPADVRTAVAPGPVQKSAVRLPARRLTGVGGTPEFHQRGWAGPTAA